jgi:hypothetical protein
MLAELAGLAPERVLLFEAGPHLFLAVAQLAGQSLGSWLRRWFDGSAGDDPEVEGPPLAEARAVAAELADLVDAVHARGLVFRDLSPEATRSGPPPAVEQGHPRHPAPDPAGRPRPADLPRPQADHPPGQQPPPHQADLILAWKAIQAMGSPP